MVEPSSNQWWTQPPQGQPVALPPPTTLPIQPRTPRRRHGAALAVAAVAAVAALGAGALTAIGGPTTPSSTEAAAQAPAPRPLAPAGPATDPATAPESDRPSTAPAPLPVQTPAKRRGNGEFPPAGIGEQSGRLLPAVDSGTDGAYTFMNLADDGQPARFSPCRPLHLVVNSAAAPPGGYDAIVEAVAAVSGAAGLQIVVDGETAEPVSLDRRPYQPERYGDRWAPVLVGWLAESGERVAGHGGPSSVTLVGTGEEYNVSGVVSLDSADPANTDPRIMRLVAMHELAHVLGLGHSTDPSELMAPVLDWQTGFGPGDLAGLAVAGAGPCTDDV